MIDMTGKEIGRYQFKERLGAGGMAMVYKAYDSRLEREVAIKIIQTDVFAPNVLAEVLARFEREAKALARLNHPHIVKVYDFGDFDNLPYLVMEYHAGGTVKRFTNSPHPYYDCARLLGPVARALEYAHQRGILHRDVKPSNILLNEHHQPMLTDFGIAKILEMSASTGLTASGVGIGTPEYIAPEQGVGSGADPRSDVYSLGIVLYELITGRRPYSADTPMGVILAHVTKPLPNPRDFIPDLPDHVIGVIYTALAKEPNDRFADMGTFAEALEQLAAERPTAQSIRPAAGPADATSIAPVTAGRIPTPQPGTMMPVHTPSPASQPGSQPGSRPASQPGISQPASQPGSQPGSRPASQPGISQPASQPSSRPASQPGISQPVSQPIYPAEPAPRTPAPQTPYPVPGPEAIDFGQTMNVPPEKGPISRPGGQPAEPVESLQYGAEVQPTLQTPAPTQYSGQPRAAGAASSMPASRPVERPPQFRPKTTAPAKAKTSSTQWIILGVLGILAIAVIGVGISMLMKNNPVAAVPTTPVTGGQAGMATVTDMALIPVADTSAPAAPTETITPLPSPTPLPQFISDQFDHALALIPIGEFLMGSLPEDQDVTANDDERPQHSQAMTSFYMDVHETTNFDYAQCVAEGQCQPPANLGSSTTSSYYDNPEFANYPVLFVPWKAAADYCKWRGGRLPTEAEWEYAARGGLVNMPYSWGDQPPSCESQAETGANSSQCPYSGPVPVGGFGNNNFGLYDMAGNVAEWTSSLYRPYPYNPADGREDPVPVEQRVLRGGSWNSEVSSMRNAARRAINQNAQDSSIGFRCVVDLETVTQGSGGSSGQADGGSGVASTPAPSSGGDQPGVASPTPTRVFVVITPIFRFTPITTFKIIPILPTVTPTPTLPTLILPTKIFLLPTPTPTTPLIIINPTRIFILPSSTPTSPPIIILPTKIIFPTLVLPTNTPVPPPTWTPVPIRKLSPEILSPSAGGTYSNPVDFCIYTGYGNKAYAYAFAIDGKWSDKIRTGDDQKVCDSASLTAGMTHTFEVTVFYDGGSWSDGVKFDVSLR